MLIPPKDVMRKLEEESKNEKIVRDHVSYNHHLDIGRLKSRLYTVQYIFKWLSFHVTVEIAHNWGSRQQVKILSFKKTV